MNLVTSENYSINLFMAIVNSVSIQAVVGFATFNPYHSYSDICEPAEPAKILGKGLEQGL
jgi:hypothetical protein